MMLPGDLSSRDLPCWCGNKVSSATTHFAIRRSRLLQLLHLEWVLCLDSFTFCPIGPCHLRGCDWLRRTARELRVWGSAFDGPDFSTRALHFRFEFYASI